MKPSVTIVGASFAGLACAVKLIEEGITPTIIDAKPEPTVNTTGGVASWWFKGTGVEVPPEAVSADLRGLRLISPGGEAAEWHVQDNIGSVLYPEKYVQHYVDKLERAGCAIIRPATYMSYQDGMVSYTHDGITVAQPVTYLVAADGANSGVGRSFGRPAIGPDDLHFGYEETLDNPGGYDPETIYIYIDSGICKWGYWWVFPDDFGKRVRVGLGIPKSVGQNPKSNFYDKLLKKHPEFDGKPAELDGVLDMHAGHSWYRQIGGQIPTAPLPASNEVKGLTMRRVLFVGDAGRFCSPLHGGGIGFGIISGVLAAQAIVSKGSYDKLWRKQLKPILKRHYALKRMLYGWSDSDFDKAVKALSTYPMDITSTDPNEHIGDFIMHLAKTSPRLIPKFVRLAL